jgi:hypothetical protein
MHNKNTSKNYFTREKNVPWYKGPGFSIGMMLLSTSIWFGYSMRTLNSIDYVQKRLILRSEGCAYLHIHNLQTRPYPITNTCTIEVPFKYLTFSDNGLIWADDQSTVFVNGSQIVAVEALPDQPWPPARHRDFSYVAICTLVYFAILTFLFIKF